MSESPVPVDSFGPAAAESPDALAAGTAMGTVTLKVADLDAMVAYYRDGVGLQLLREEKNVATLGRGSTEVLNLQEARELKHAPASAAGLYHTALLFPDRSDLAAAVYSVASRFPRSFTGSSDHLVSQALYFDDPEGNGVELYWDRPRTEWRWNGNRVDMGTLYLDPNAFLQQNLTEQGAAAGMQGQTGVGHVHLRVGDIASARAFYVDVLGFAVTAEFPGQALFVSAGGYHHHLGMNTWQSAGAGLRTPALGLGEVTITLPSPDDLGALRDRLSLRGVPTHYDGAVLSFDDPWANRVLVELAGKVAG